MHPRLFAEWAEMDERLRRTISARAEDTLAHSGAGGSRHDHAAGEFLFVVSRDDTKTYRYLKHAMESEDVIDVVLDRRNGDRRHVGRPRLPDRRHECRRQRDVTSDLNVHGWALVHR